MINDRIVNNYTRTGFCILWSLVFYISFIGCIEKRNSGSISIQWEKDKPVAIIVPQKFLKSVSKDSVKDLMQIRLSKRHQPIIGDYLFEDDKIIFRPIIAFTRGLKYQVYIRNELIDEIEIQAVHSTIAPEIVAVYPALDTLPENLLKFYISFSKPMQEGDALSNIHLIKDDHDTLSSVFLDMELWNNERTMLTLWLDPGRIKRGLQPNKLLGSPLDRGSYYQLAIDKNWQDAEGILLKQNFTKKFFTGPRDNVSPNEQAWTINAPRAKTKEHLKISFNESLDHVLAGNTISVSDVNDNEVKGKLKVNDYGTILYFLPDVEWKKGIYIVQIESRLEDLSGNNLDRLFDTDLTQTQPSSNTIHKRQFEVR